MNLINILTFFALIVTANCLILDTIYETFEKKCNQSRLLLKRLPLNLDLCKTSGDRGIDDLLCHGIATTVLDICSKSSNITLKQVTNSAKLNDSLSDFCNKVGSVKIDPDVPHNNVSENLKTMTTDCSWFCSEKGRLNQMCPFLVSFAELKNYTISTKNVSSPAAVKDTVPINVNNTDKQEPIKKDSVPEQKPLHEIDDKIIPDQKPLHEIDDKIEPGAVENDPKDSNVPPVINQEPETNPAGEKKPPAVSNPDQGGENPPPDQNEFSKGGNAELQPSNTQDGENNEGNQKTIEEGDLEIQEKESDSDLPNTKISSENRHQVSEEPFVEAESSNFFTYFVFISALCMFFYVAMYNKKKILALLIEGRRTNVKRRPNTAAYSKLDCNLEEAMASGPSTSTSNTLLY